MRPSGSPSPLDRRSSIEETIERYLDESSKRQDSFEEWPKKFRENTYRILKRHHSAIKGLEKKVKQLAQAVHSSMADDSKSANQVKTVITKSSPNTHCCDSLDSNTALCTSVISNLVEQEIFVKSCKREETPKSMLIIGTFTGIVKRRIAEEQEKTFQESLEKVPTRIKEVSMVKLNARCSAVLQNKLPSKEKDLGSFILPCIIGLGNPKPIRMLIEMADKSMQSPKGIIENVLVKIEKFIFPVDFIILDIVEDEKVTIILGRPMLANAHARIDVFGKKNSFEVPNGFGVQENLEEFLMNDDINADLGDFLELNDLQLEYDGDPFGVPLDSESEIGIGLDDFSRNLEDLLIKQAPQFGQNKFIEKGLTEILLGRPFKDSSGLEESVTEGLVWFKIGDNKTIFQMPRTISRIQHLPTKQFNMMAPVLRVIDEDKDRGFNHPYQIIKMFYKGCLQLGDEYKRDEKVIEWIIHGHASIHDMT
ncbi:retrovirus-related pol polyprotein from transposon TNT 1-94 [Tanacetum coccineum]